MWCLGHSNSRSSFPILSVVAPKNALLRMASDNSIQGQEKRTFDDPLFSYNLHSILDLDTCLLPGIKSDAQCMSCQCLSYPTNAHGSSKLVSFLQTGETGGSILSFVAQIQYQVCTSSTRWSICVGCASSTRRFSLPRQMKKRLYHVHRDYY